MLLCVVDAFWETCPPIRLVRCRKRNQKEKEKTKVSVSLYITGNLWLSTVEPYMIQVGMCYEIGAFKNCHQISGSILKKKIEMHYWIEENIFRAANVGFEEGSKPK